MIRCKLDAALLNTSKHAVPWLQSAHSPRQARWSPTQAMPDDHGRGPWACFGEPRRIDRRGPRHGCLPLCSNTCSLRTRGVGYAWAAYQYGERMPCGRYFGGRASGGGRL